MDGHITGTYLTIRDIASKLSLPRHSVRYLLDSRKIPPVRKLGSVHLYGLAEFELVRQARQGLEMRATSG